ncbi:MAG: S-methyl-5'-thioinosine phosphorylase [Burkholderiales bacterium]|nr:S-methyl-5'-thioinosine phosphorylase [Burkholderiales bacterium]
MLGIVGGSSLTDLAGLALLRREIVRTPYGEPSGPLAFGTIAGRAVVFLARHGFGSTIAPHEVNYRANIWALHAAGVTDVVSVASVGGIRGDLAPGVLAVPDQIIDYTHGRAATFFAHNGRPVTHIDFTHPYCEAMRERLLAAAAAAGETVVSGGTYAATQGPRLETAAEIDRLERDGAHMVGMTGMPEAALAREIGLCYGAIAVVVNHAAGRGASAERVRLEDIAAVGRRAALRVHGILHQVVARHGG